MIWIVIFLSAALVLGGVLGVRPSKAQLQVAEIRESAIQRGIHVKLPVSLRFPESIEKPRQPFYCLHLGVKTFSNSHYCVLRDGDRIGNSSGDLSATLKTQIDKVLLATDEDVVGFYMGDGLVGFSWQESAKQGALENLLEAIDEVQSLLKNSA